MKIILANPRGFCAGVNMAIQCLEQCVELFGSNIYVYHEIVHNKYVVERFSNQGVTFVDSVDEVPDGSVYYLVHMVSHPKFEYNQPGEICKPLMRPARWSPKCISKRFVMPSRAITLY